MEGGYRQARRRRNRQTDRQTHTKANGTVMIFMKKHCYAAAAAVYVNTWLLPPAVGVLHCLGCVNKTAAEPTGCCVLSNRTDVPEGFMFCNVPLLLFVN